jgi:outer membrane protein
MRQGFLAAALVAAGMFVFSSTQAAAGSPKIAVVDLQQVITGSHRGQEAQAALKQEVDKLQAQAEDKNNKRKAYKDQLDKADSKSADYAKLLKQYQDADNEFQSYVGESRQLIQQRQQELLQPIQQELQNVVNRFVKDNNIDILLSKGGGALTATEAYDVTTKVTEAMDKDWAALQKSSPAPAASTKGN